MKMTMLFSGYFHHFLLCSFVPYRKHWVRSTPGPLSVSLTAARCEGTWGPWRWGRWRCRCSRIRRGSSRPPRSLIRSVENAAVLLLTADGTTSGSAAASREAALLSWWCAVTKFFKDGWRKILIQLNLNLSNWYVPKRYNFNFTYLVPNFVQIFIITIIILDIVFLGTYGIIPTKRIESFEIFF